MVETKGLIESDFVGVEYIELQSTPVIGVIVDEGIIVANQYNNIRLQLKIFLNHQEKKWSVNQRSNKNLAKVWGSDSKAWVGKTISFKVEEIQKKKAVVAYPVDHCEVGL